MPKVKVHLRVASNGTRRHKVQANINAVSAPLTDSNGYALPTIAFAVVLDIDPAAFRTAERVIAELAIGEDDVAIAAELAP